MQFSTLPFLQSRLKGHTYKQLDEDNETQSTARACLQNARSASAFAALRLEIMLLCESIVVAYNLSLQLVRAMSENLQHAVRH